MAGDLRLNRISKFYGGITLDDKSNKVGASLNIEELDIFSSSDYIQPETIFAEDTVITRKITGYAFDSLGQAYALGQTAGGNVQIWKNTDPGIASPGHWANLYSASALSANANSPLAIHIVSGTAQLFYVTGGGVLTRVNTDGSSESTDDTVPATMSLTGVGSFQRFPMLVSNGELYVGSANQIAKVDSTGVFIGAAFTLPTGWNVIDFDVIGDAIVILGRHNSRDLTYSRLFFWDKTSLTGVDDEVVIPMGGPQIVVNHNEVVRVVCSQNGSMKVFQLDSKIPRLTHRLNNLQLDANLDSQTNQSQVIPVQTKFIRNNILHFGVWKTDKSGLYALGQTDEDKPLALVLIKRFNTTDYSLHKPLAAASFGYQYFLSYSDNGTVTSMVLKEGSSPTRSSNAVYESIYIDAGSPETVKEWPGIMAVAKSMPSGCNIKLDARVDGASVYDTTIGADSSMTLDISNDQQRDGTTADRFWERKLPSLAGRALQTKLSFTSNGTSCPQLYNFAILSREWDIF